MKIYFVRHGFTDSNKNNINQPPDSVLNQQGIAQAKELSKRFSKITLDVVISSPFSRTVDTAREISPQPILSPLFVEVRKPSEIIGQPKKDDFSQKILKKIYEMSLVDPTWHYSDEENFTDLKARGFAALEFLKHQNKENILVVSHENFIVLLFVLMLFGEDCTVEMYYKIKKFVKLSNTGISICTYDQNQWQLQCWNDTAHLLD